MAITVTLSYGVGAALVAQSIYTLKLARRGKLVPQALQANFHYVRSARDVMETDVVTVSPSIPFDASWSRPGRWEPPPTSWWAIRTRCSA